MSGPPRPPAHRRFAPFVDRIAHEGADPWALHWQARLDAAAGKDVILLSVGDPDLDTPAAVVDVAVERLRAGDTHYTESAGPPGTLRPQTAHSAYRRAR